MNYQISNFIIGPLSFIVAFRNKPRAFIADSALNSYVYCRELSVKFGLLLKLCDIINFLFHPIYFEEDFFNVFVYEILQIGNHRNESSNLKKFKSGYQGIPILMLETNLQTLPFQLLIEF